MNDHEHDYWRTPTGALECVCGKPLARALPLSAAEQAEVDRFGIFDDEVSS